MKITFDSDEIYRYIIVVLAFFGVCNVIGDCIALIYAALPERFIVLDRDSRSFLTGMIEAHLTLVLILVVGLYAYKRVFGTYPNPRVLLSERSAAGGKILAEDQFIVSQSDPRDLLSHYVKKADDTANRVLKRSELFLFIGVTIAFAGVAVFSPIKSEVRITDYGNNASLWSFLVVISQYLPSFGILFFIEFIAFFFLRQYRLAMDDFRYYDSIKRKNEQNLVLLKMFSENPDRVSTKEVIAAMIPSIVQGAISKDQTTEMIESRRNIRDELSVFTSVLDAFSSIVTQKREKEKPEGKK